LSHSRIAKQIHKIYQQHWFTTKLSTMNPTFVTTRCFFLFAFTTFFPSPFTLAQIVTDLNGNFVDSTKRYAILPDSTTSGGELMLGKTENATCNLTLLQRHHGDGLPVKFIPTMEVHGDPIVIDTDTDLDILYLKTSQSVQIHGIQKKIRDGLVWNCCIAVRTRILSCFVSRYLPVSMIVIMLAGKMTKMECAWSSSSIVMKICLELYSFQPEDQ